MTGKRNAFVMSITPFDAKGAFDEPAFRAHLRRLRDAGVGVYVAGSASGEGFSLSSEEREAVFAISIEELKGHVPVRAMGCEVRHAEETLEFLRAAQRHPFDAVHVFAPEMGHASKPSLGELEAYYATAVAGTSHPVVLSSYQSLGFDVPVVLLERLVERFPQIIGYFYGGSDVRYLSQVLARLCDRIEIHCAGPYNALTTLALGGTGFMGHEGNLSPQLVAGVISAFERGDLARLRELYTMLMAVHVMHYRHGGPVRAMKPLLNALGLPGGSLRLPRMAIDDAALQQVLAATLALGIPGLPSTARA